MAAQCFRVRKNTVKGRNSRLSTSSGSGIVPAMKLPMIIASLFALLCAGCAADQVVVQETAPKVEATTRAFTPTCRPVSEEFARRLRGDYKLADSLDDPAKTRSADVMAAGFCDTANVRHVIESREKSLLYCFEEEATSSDGRIVMRWELGSTGKVQHLCVSEDTVKSVEVQNCLNQRISLMRFKPSSEGPCMITWPFVFKRGSGIGR